MESMKIQKREGLPTTEARASSGRVKGAFSLGPRAWRGAALSLLVAGLVVWFGVFLSSPPASLQLWLFNLLFVIVVGLASIMLGKPIVGLLEKFQRIPLLYRWLLVGVVFLLFMLLRDVVLLTPNVIGVITIVVLSASFLGAGVGALTRTRDLRPIQKGIALGALLLGGLFMVGATLWVVWPGPGYRLPEYATQVHNIAPLALENPAQPGPYPVLTLTYGSGTDRHRPEYGDEVGLRTEPVDVSGLVGGWRGLTGWQRSLFWGFDLVQAPLNARVWHPEGEGPFPLVLVVHGNHAMDDFSEGGYDYLGELLASRGFIVASVDQNFLNGGLMTDVIFGGLTEDNDARAYLLLEHLRLWHLWNETADHPFYLRVDTDNIALIGHSRGGEAAAIAAAFNGLPAHPDAASIRFHHDYGIRGVVAIAPSDGQYRPRQRGTPLENISYLALQGAADGDVRSFEGTRQYDRLAFTDGGDLFKAAVYVYGANHGQFNTTWGRVDRGSQWFLNHGDIMPRVDQERIGKVFISAFLEAALRGNDGYQALFENPLRGRDWLPQSVYLSQYLHAATELVATFEEDLNLETSTLAGGRLSGENLTTWREQAVSMAGGRRTRDTAAVYLGWDEAVSGTPSYRVELPDDLSLSEDSVWTFALANTTAGGEPLDLTLEVVDRAGERASLPLSSIRPLPPALGYRMFKAPLQVAFESEPVFTTYAFSLADFIAVNEALEPATLHELRFVFDRSPAGEVILDDIGFRSP